MLQQENTNCKFCLKKIKGRIDKKFCDDYCRNNYNNRLNSDVVNVIRNTNNKLRKNRRILEQILSATEQDTAKATKSKLQDLGFDFKFMTNIYKTNNDKVYYFCYEYGYMPTDNDWVIVVKSKQ